MRLNFKKTKCFNSIKIENRIYFYLDTSTFCIKVIGESVFLTMSKIF